MKKILLAVVGIIMSGFALQAGASSDEAWKEFHVRVTRACVSASAIRNHSASTIIGFDDRVGTVAMLVSDRTRGSTLSKLCLYDKRARRAYVDNADMWSAPPQPH